MSQPTYVMAFRKRLKKRGYSDIKIFSLLDDDRKPTGRYLVSAVDPLVGIPISREFESFEIMLKFKPRGY